MPQSRSEHFGKVTSLVPAWNQTAVPHMSSSSAVHYTDGRIVAPLSQYTE